MTPADFYAIMRPAAAALGGVFDGPQSRLLMLAIAGQESAWTDRIQVPGGQARGFWQCEQAGMLRGVVASRFTMLAHLCDAQEIPYDDETAMFEALAWHDHLAYTVARLGLWLDPHPLPAVGDIDGAWDVYSRVWRPGKPSRDRWTTVYPQALHVIRT